MKLVRITGKIGYFDNQLFLISFEIDEIKIKFFEYISNRTIFHKVNDFPIESINKIQTNYLPYLFEGEHNFLIYLHPISMSKRLFKSKIRKMVLNFFRRKVKK